MNDYLETGLILKCRRLTLTLWLWPPPTNAWVAWAPYGLRSWFAWLYPLMVEWNGEKRGLSYRVNAE